MASELRNYKNSADVSVEKGLGGSYIVNVSEYSFGEKVRENTYTFSTYVDLYPSIGIYKNLHPSTYQTDTEILNKPVALDPGGTTCIFTDCHSLVSVNLVTDVSVGSMFNTHHHAFAGCESLTTVNLGTLFEDISDNYCDFENMFEGCTNLTTISGTIDFTNLNGIGAIKDMFKGCENLQSVTIKNGSGANDITAENVTVLDKTYNYAYEVMGLTTEQFNSIVILV